MAKKPLTADQVRQSFRSRGITIAKWAAEHGYDAEKVSRVLRGVEKGAYGQSHEIAVKLGLKVPEDESSAERSERNTQKRRAA